MDLRELTADFKIAGVGVGATWTRAVDRWDLTEAERLAAWKLLLQLGTRTTVAPLPHDQGLLREALGSLHAVFGVTRQILEEGGPEISRDKPNGDPSIAALAALILNDHIRPVLSRWHPLLADHEALRPADVGPLTWERSWPHEAEARNDLTALREVLRGFLRVLGRAAGADTFAQELTPDDGT